MTNEELVSLIQQGENVSENMGILYQQNKDKIRNIVNRFVGLAEFDDLMQEAYIGLKNAVDNYEKKNDASFFTYATFNKVGNVAVKAGKAVAVGIGAGATALTVLSKKAIDEYSNYEQLAGGVETLFKDSSSKVLGYANEAYRTAGLSANQYMETVTGFSASLLQSLGGDTALASEKANQAVIDMSDNANKMGTSIEAIQNAYQGFAKQNYTMLDNLKLGYGGTKEEMQRLLDDAEKISGMHLCN